MWVGLALILTGCAARDVAPPDPVAAPEGFSACTLESSPDATMLRYRCPADLDMSAHATSPCHYFREHRKSDGSWWGIKVPAYQICYEDKGPPPTPKATHGSQGLNCHWVRSYTRRDGTRVRGHQRCR